MATGRVGPYEKEYFRKDGTKRWLLFAGSSLGNNQCVEFCVDISDRKKAETALRESEERLRAVLSTLPSMRIAVIDEAGMVQSVNPAASGRCSAIRPINPWQKRLHAHARAAPLRAPRLRQGFLCAQGDAKIIGKGREIKGRRKDGNLFPADLTVAEWRVSGKRYFTGIMRDINRPQEARGAGPASAAGGQPPCQKLCWALVQAIASQTASSRPRRLPCPFLRAHSGASS